MHFFDGKLDPLFLALKKHVEILLKNQGIQDALPGDSRGNAEFGSRVFPSFWF